MKLRVTVLFCAIWALGWSRIPIAFTGIQSSHEPLIQKNLERQVRFQLLDLKGIDLLSPDKTSHFLREVPNGFQFGDMRKSQLLLEDLGAKILVSGILGDLEMGYSRIWWRPWKGNAQLIYDLELIVAGEGSLLYKGTLRASSTIENVYLGKRPLLSKIDPIARHYSMGELVKRLAKEVELVIRSVVAGPISGPQSDNGPAAETVFESPASFDFKSFSKKPLIIKDGEQEAEPEVKDKEEEKKSPDPVDDFGDDEEEELDELPGI